MNEQNLPPLTRQEKAKLLRKHFKKRPLFIYDDLCLSKVSEKSQSEIDNSYKSIPRVQVQTGVDEGFDPRTPDRDYLNFDTAENMLQPNNQSQEESKVKIEDIDELFNNRLEKGKEKKRKSCQ